jgi:3-methyl-2-oxobutanoate hydroxymethyltransferase
MDKITAPAIRERKGSGELISVITAYDYPTALITDSAGADILLVGDSLGQVVLGYPSTLPVTMEEMLHHTKAVRRGCSRALLVGDMPFMSCRCGLEETLRNAARFMHEAGAEAVKIEGGKTRKDLIRAVVDLDIPVMGHIGLTPQSVNRFGGYRVQGATTDRAVRLLEDARAVEDAGAFSMVLECVPRELAEIVTRNVSIPTIGIGAGPGCDGQVLVIHDLLGVFDTPTPKFVRIYANLRKDIETNVRAYLDDVKNGRFPSDGESYHMPAEVLARVREKVQEKGWKL